MTYGVRLSLLATVLFLPVLGAAHAETASTLAQQGLTDGLSIVDDAGSESFYLRVPSDVTLANPSVRLHLEVAPSLLRGSSVQVFINGVPRTQIPIGELAGTATERQVSLPLSPNDLKSRFIAVRVVPVFIGVAMPCITERANRGYLRILPDSGLLFDDAHTARQTVRAFLSLLGPSPRVRLPGGAVTPQEFRTILAVASYLRSQGRQPVWQNDASMPADIVISRDRSARGLALMHDPAGGTSLVVSTLAPQALLLGPWTDLLASDQFSSSTTPNQVDGPASRALTLAQFGVTAEAVPLDGRAAWTFSLPPETMRRRQPDGLHLNLVVPPSLPGNPLLLHVFDNGSLRNVVALPDLGGPVSVNLPLVEANGPISDSLRLVLVRQNDTGNCQGTLAHSWAQILPSSTVTTKGIAPADTLDTIGRSFEARAPVYLPPDALREPAAWMPLLSGVVNDLRLNPYNLTIHADASVPAPGQTFLWLRPETPGGFSAPIRFDRGRIRIVESNGNILLDSPPLPTIEFATVLRRGGDRGLWIKSDVDAAAIRPLGFDTAPGDLVLMDRNGQITSIDTRVFPAGTDRAPAVSYPESQSWLDRVQNARLWVLGGGLFALTLIFLSILDKLRRHHPDGRDS